MPSFSKNSEIQLNSCERDIQTIMREVIKDFDITIVEGQRTAERQQEHWSKGRDLISPDLDPKIADNWEIVDRDKVVTFKDGYVRKSIHQSEPKSRAIDVVPYPTMWSNQDKLDELRGAIKITQARLFREGKITKVLENGYDLWNGFDKPHWQLQQ